MSSNVPCQPETPSSKSGFAKSWVTTGPKGGAGTTGAGGDGGEAGDGGAAPPNWISSSGCSSMPLTARPVCRCGHPLSSCALPRVRPRLGSPFHSPSPRLWTGFSRGRTRLTCPRAANQVRAGETSTPAGRLR